MQFSTEIDPGLVEQLATTQVVSLLVAGALAALVLAAWFVPALGGDLPSYWAFMKANTAVAALASMLSLLLSWPRLGKRAYRASRAIAAVVGIAAVTVLLEYTFHFSLWVETLLPNDARLTQPGRMAPQTALCFALLSFVIFFLRRRKRWVGTLVDVTISLLCVIVLVNAAGTIYGATRLFGLSASNRTGPTTLFCLVLLTFVAFGRRAEYGVFGIMLGNGIGSRISRAAFPVAFVLPFVLEAAQNAVIRTKFLSSAYATAFTATLAVLLAFALILVLALRIESLEKEIVDLSLRDELTQLFNRRGFYAMAEHSLWLAQRSQKPFSVLFMDLDNLKEINDMQGHDAGSRFLRETAELLTKFSRKTDVVGRVGGDEFVMAGQSNEDDVCAVAERLNRMVEKCNAQAEREYPFSISVGCATSDAGGTESLHELLQRADAAMYAVKRERKLLHGQDAPSRRTNIAQ